MGPFMRHAAVWLCLACGSHALLLPPSGLQVRPRASGLESGLWRARAHQRQAHEQWQRSCLPMMSERVPSVNKQALVDAIAQKAGVSKKTAAVVLTATLDVIVDSVCDGHKVSLIGFGSFHSKDRPKREARNPKTGEKMIVEAVRLAPKLRTHPPLAPTQRDAGAFVHSLSPSRLLCPRAVHQATVPSFTFGKSFKDAVKARNPIGD